MSENISDEVELVIYSNDDNWNSANSLTNQKGMNLSKSETDFFIPLTKLTSLTDVTFKELELDEWSQVTERINKKWEENDSDSNIPRLIFTKSHLRDELEILKINLSEKDKMAGFSDVKQESKGQRKVDGKSTRCKKLWKFWRIFVPVKVRDLMTEIEDSETAKKDATAWKFLKRVSAIKKKLLLKDSYVLHRDPVRLTCPNCTFFVITNTKKVSTIKTKLYSVLCAIIGLCIETFTYYSFKDTVHLCPLCKIYLGFCPAIRKQSFKRKFDVVEIFLN